MGKRENNTYLIIMATTDILKTTIYIVRHGECSANVTQTALDPFTDVLTEVGRTQAELLGKCLKNVPFTRAYASDYPRGMETAQIILRQSELASEDILVPEKRLRERDYTGIIDQKASVAINVLMDAMKKGTPYLQVEMPESETVKQFEDRIINLLSEIIQDLKKSTANEETILFASHGLTIQRLMVLLNQRSKDLGVDNWERNLFSEKLMRNTTFHKLVLEIPRDGHSPVSGRCECAHFREHINGAPVDVTKKTLSGSGDIRDNNWTFLDERKNDLSKFEDETAHFCKPV